MSESERRAHLAEVGHNLFRLPRARVRFDLFSDVAERVTHGLFSTTQAALARRAAVLEDLRLARPAGSADVDLDHLEGRFAQGGVQLVYLEVANNALFGWPLSHANVAAARAACDRHGARRPGAGHRHQAGAGAPSGAAPAHHARRRAAQRAGCRRRGVRLADRRTDSAAPRRGSARRRVLLQLCAGRPAMTAAPELTVTM